MEEVKADQAAELLSKKPTYKELYKLKFGKDFDELTLEEKEKAVDEVNKYY
jgi:hypothetical protein